MILFFIVLVHTVETMYSATLFYLLIIVTKKANFIPLYAQYSCGACWHKYPICPVYFPSINRLCYQIITILGAGDTKKCHRKSEPLKFEVTETGPSVEKQVHELFKILNIYL